MHDIFSGFSPDSFDPLGDGLDAAYWESVFPGQTADDYNWLRMTVSPAPESNGINGGGGGGGQMSQMQNQQQQQLQQHQQRIGMPSPLSGPPLRGTNTHQAPSGQATQRQYAMGDAYMQG